MTLLRKQRTLVAGAACAVLAACGQLRPGQPSFALPNANRVLTVAERQLTRQSTERTGFRSLYTFKGGLDGSFPLASLINLNGTLYGTTEQGGDPHRRCGSICGTVFLVSESGRERILYRFRSTPDGQNPVAGLAAVNGLLYGTTEYGGGGHGCGQGCGTVFKIDTSGREAVLYRFKGGNDGAFPHASLINLNGLLYGTTFQGGGSGYCFNYEYGCGTIFSVTTSGRERVLYRFRGGLDGNFPEGSLVAEKGVLYGTASSGGESGCDNGCGTVFSITASGQEKTLHNFNGADGAWPSAGLVSVGGVLYGTTQDGLGNYDCPGFGCGSVFSITTSGREKVLYFFTAGTDGAHPVASLTPVNGLLYGTTSSGGGTGCGGVGCGTIFSVSASGQERILYRFSGHAGGGHPVASLRNVRGVLYGTASGEGTTGLGTVFKLSP